MIYLRVGLFAEGPTDYHFLLALLDQLVDEVAADLLAGSFQSAPSLGIDAPRSMRSRSREERIAAAIEASWDECTLFVIHGDGAGDPDGARRAQIEPGIVLARAAHRDLAAAACVPVRETEAWMLADASAFSRMFETEKAPSLPHDPESENDPKKTLRGVLSSMGAKVDRGIARYYAEIGKATRPVNLRSLPTFRNFEKELRTLIAAMSGGTPPQP